MFKRLFNSIGKFLGSSITSAGIWSWALPGQWSKADLIKQYTRIMFSVISAIAEDAAKITFVVYKDTEPDDTPIAKHPFVAMMKRPNPDYSQFQFLELHFTYLKLTGESYWYILRDLGGRPRECYLMRPELMQVVVAKNNNPLGLVTGYLMTKADGTKIPFEKEEVLHFKMPNPQNPYYGMGPIEAARTYIQTEQFTADWTKMSLYNAGRPSGIVSIKGTISEEQFNEAKKKFKEEYSGVQNAGKTLFLRGNDGVDYQKLGMELQELALKELKDLSRDDIMMMFRVSKTMLGISEDVSLNNARESRAFFRESITLSEWDRLTDHLTAFLLPSYDRSENTYIGYEYPDLQSGEEKITEWSTGHNKWLTTNDIRRERGLKPLPGGDVIREPVGLVPITSDKPREPKKPDDTGKPGDDDGEPGKPGDNGKKRVSRKKKELAKKDIFEKELFNLQDAWTPVYLKAINAEFATQEQEILDRHPQKTIDWLFDIEASKERIIGALLPIGLELMTQAARLALDLANDTDTEFLVDQRVQEYVRDRTERLAGLMNTATITLLEQSIAEGIKNGESLAKLTARVREIYDEATTTRAERIARTESLAASNEGALEAYKQSPLVVKKEWSASPGACEFCLAFDGKVVELNENFAPKGVTIPGEDGGSYNINYENIEHPPLHPNCRCAILPVAD